MAHAYVLSFLAMLHFVINTQGAGPALPGPAVRGRVTGVDNTLRDSSLVLLLRCVHQDTHEPAGQTPLPAPPPPPSAGV